METERRFIEAWGGGRIAAVVHRPEGTPLASVLCQHGLYSNKEGSWELRADYLAERGFRAVRFDRRGYGESDGRFHEFTLTTGIKDSIAVMDFLEGRGEGDFAVLGSSFGGLIAIHAAARDPRVGALSLRAPVTYTDEILPDLREEVMKRGRVELKEMPGEHIERRFFEDLDAYDLESAVADIDVPTLIFHGTQDQIVPLEGTEEFYRKLESEKELVEVEGEGHIFSEEGDRDFLRGSVEWFSQVFREGGSLK